MNPWRDQSLEGYIKRRGLEFVRKNPRDALILPSNCNEATENLFYQLLKKYSFRLFLRDVIKHRDSFHLEDLLRYCPKPTASKYLDLLLKEGVVKKDGQRYRLVSNTIYSFGETFEWFVAQIFQREFNSPAFWGVKLKGGRYGGDYDILAEMEGHLVYVEIKSAPPKHIELKDISAFFNRLEDIAPHLSLFLEDTNLRMKDKLVVLFQEELKNQLGKNAFPVIRLRDEIFCIEDSLFIMNSIPDLIQNIGFCLRHYLKRVGIMNLFRATLRRTFGKSQLRGYPGEG